MALIEGAHAAAHLLLDHAYVRIVSRDEPDAVLAAVLLGHALRRENVDFHFTAVERLDAPTSAALAAEDPDIVVLIGLTEDAVDLETVPGKRIILGRTLTQAPGEIVINAAALPADEPAAAPLSCFAYYVALSMSKRNRDLALLPVAAAFAHGGHVDGLKGLAHDVLEQGVEAGTLLSDPGLALHGPTLEQALSQLEMPYVAGVTGRARNVKKLLQELRVAAEAAPNSLSPENAERVGSFLTLRLLAQSAPEASWGTLFRPQVRALAGPHTGMDAAGLARQAEAASAVGRGGLAFAALWPDTSAGAELLAIQVAHRDAMVAALLKADRDRTTEGPLVVTDAPSAGACLPLATRLATSLCAAGQVALVRHIEGDVATFAARGFTAPKLAAASRKAAEVAGAHVRGGASWMRAEVGAAEAERFVKALAEALA